MPKVYIPNKSSHNFDSAKQYGELVYVTEGNVNRYATNKMYRQIAEVLSDSCADDFIVVTGMPELQIVLNSYFATKHGKLNLLLFQSRNGKPHYVVRELLIGGSNE